MENDNEINPDLNELDVPKIISDKFASVQLYHTFMLYLGQRFHSYSSPPIFVVTITYVQ